MILDIQLLLKEVLEMKDNIKNNLVISKEQYKEKYNYIYLNTPTLFELIYKNEHEYLEQLNYMVKNAIKVEKNEVSQYDADVEVGSVLAKQYVYSKIDMEKEKKM